MTWADVTKNKPCKGECKWPSELEKCEDMLDDADYDYAWDFLGNLARWIKKHKHVTDKQKIAIRNIMDNPGNNDHDDLEFGSMWDLLGD